MASIEHLVALGYVDPHDLARMHAEGERCHAATLSLAQAQIDAGELGEARDALTELAGAAPAWTAPRRLLAQVEVQSGRAAEAISHLDWLEEHGVEHAELALLRAAAELRRRRFDDALAAAEYARALREPFPAADVAIAGAHPPRAPTPAAAEAFEQALGEEPHRTDALAGMAAVALRRGEPEAAVDFALRALDADMTVPAVHQRLGIALAQLGNMPAAEAAFRTAATLGPRLAGPCRRLARLAEERGDHAAAAAMRQQGRELVRRRRAAAKSTTVTPTRPA